MTCCCGVGITASDDRIAGVWGDSYKVKGMRPSLIAWGLVVLAAGSAGASAASLDKSACNVLKTELAGMVATGARADMERGPEWAKANLPREKLLNIHRLIELEEQLEFRCGLSHSRVAATAPAKVDKVVVPEEPEKKPKSESSVAPHDPVRTIATRSPADEPDAAAEKRASQEPSRKTTAAQPAPAKPASDPTITAATAPAPAKSSRRQSSSGYVSPTEVNPFFVTRYGDTQ